MLLISILPVSFGAKRSAATTFLPELSSG